MPAQGPNPPPDPITEGRIPDWVVDWGKGDIVPTGWWTGARATLFRRSAKVSSMLWRCLIAGLVFCALAHPASPNPVSLSSKHLLIISIDGLGYASFQRFKGGMPVLSALANEGAIASSKTVFPSMTWPSHASILTGCHPRRHGVLGNRIFERSLGRVVHASTVRYKDAFRVETLLDIAHEKGLKTAAILWPSTRQAAPVDFNIPEVYGQKKFDRWSSKGLLKRLRAAGLPSHKLGEFSKTQHFLQDSFARDAAIEILTKERPHLTLVHFLTLDSLAHSFGPNTKAFEWGLQLLDRYVGDLLAAATRAGMDSLDVMVVSDHGFLTVDERFDADKLLHRHGHIKRLSRLDDGPIRTVSNGHALFVYALKAKDGALDKVRRLFEKEERIEAVYGPRDYPALGLPTTKEEWNTPDLIVLSKPNVIFGRIFQGKNLVEKSRIPGMHGYLPSHEELRPLFIAKGPSFKRVSGATTWKIDNIDIAPTAAKHLGVSFKSPPDGRVLKELLEP